MESECQKDKVSFWNDENILKINYGDTCTTLNRLRTTEWYALNR